MLTAVALIGKPRAGARVRAAAVLGRMQIMHRWQGACCVVGRFGEGMRRCCVADAASVRSLATQRASGVLAADCTCGRGCHHGLRAAAMPFDAHAPGVHAGAASGPPLRVRDHLTGGGAAAVDL